MMSDSKITFAYCCTCVPFPSAEFSSNAAQICASYCATIDGATYAGVQFSFQVSRRRLLRARVDVVPSIFPS